MITGTTSDNSSSNKKSKKSNPIINVEDPIIKNMLEREEDELPKYFKSFGLSCIFDWDKEYKWYEVYKDHKMVLQIESGTSVEYFIQLMVELFTDVWEVPPIFLASELKNKEIFEICTMFPEFNEKIKGLNIKLED